MIIEKPNFKKICLMHLQALTNFPYIEKDFDALTDYELLCKVVDYLNQVISNNNEQNTVVENLYNAFVELKEYIDNYFDNLDVQEEINNKLDEMAEDGTLDQIIEQYLNSSAIWGFNTVADMKEATNLINGSYAKTLGYYSANDGGGATYKIREITNQDDVDESFIIALNDENLIGELIIDETINSKQIGCYIDNSHNDREKLQNAINIIREKGYKKLTLLPGNYLIEDDSIVLYEDISLITDGLVIFNTNIENKPVLHLKGISENPNKIRLSQWVGGNGSLQLVSTISKTYNTIGITIDNNSGNINDISIENINIRGYKYGIFYKAVNVWNITFKNCITWMSDVGFFYGTSLTLPASQSSNSGERICFEKCLFTQNLIDVILNGTIWSQMNFHECSFDFSNCCFYIPYKSAYGSVAINNKISLNQCHIEGIAKNIDDISQYTDPYGILVLDSFGYNFVMSITDTSFAIDLPIQYFKSMTGSNTALLQSKLILSNIYILNSNEFNPELFLSSNLNVEYDNIWWRTRPGAISGTDGARINSSPLNYKNILNPNAFFENLNVGTYATTLNTEIGDFKITNTEGLSSIVCESNSNKYNSNSKKLTINYDTSYSGEWTVNLTLLSTIFYPIEYGKNIVVQLLTNQINEYKTNVTLKWYDMDSNLLSESYVDYRSLSETSATDITKTSPIVLNPPKGTVKYKIQVQLSGGTASAGVVASRTIESIMIYDI